MKPPPSPLNPSLPHPTPLSLWVFFIFFFKTTLKSVRPSKSSSNRLKRPAKLNRTNCSPATSPLKRTRDISDGDFFFLLLGSDKDSV